MSETLTLALVLARSGYHVFPLQRNGKKPLAGTRASRTPPPARAGSRRGPSFTPAATGGSPASRPAWRWSTSTTRTARAAPRPWRSTRWSMATSPRGWSFTRPLVAATCTSRGPARAARVTAVAWGRAWTPGASAATSWPLAARPQGKYRIDGGNLRRADQHPPSPPGSPSTSPGPPRPRPTSASTSTTSSASGSTTPPATGSPITPTPPSKGRAATRRPTRRRAACATWAWSPTRRSSPWTSTTTRAVSRPGRSKTCGRR